MTTLRELTPGEHGRIISVGGEGQLRQHFLDMGMIPGAVVSVVKYAPMGDPVELIVQGYKLTLRLADAEQVEVEQLAEHRKGAFRSTRDWAKAEGSTRKEAEIRCRIRRHSALLWWETRTAARRPCSISRPEPISTLETSRE